MRDEISLEKEKNNNDLREDSYTEGTTIFNRVKVGESPQCTKYRFTAVKIITAKLLCQIFHLSFSCLFLVLHVQTTSLFISDTFFSIDEIFS